MSNRLAILFVIVLLVVVIGTLGEQYIKARYPSPCKEITHGKA